MSLIEIKNISKSFYKKDKFEIKVLSDINFTVKKGECFVIIGPNGELTERESLLHGLRNAYKSRKVVKIWIENFQTYRREGDLIITTYEEWQQGCDDSVNARISTAIFQEKPDTPNGVMWLHVHETWLKK